MKTQSDYVLRAHMLTYKDCVCPRSDHATLLGKITLQMRKPQDKRAKWPSPGSSASEWQAKV